MVIGIMTRGNNGGFCNVLLLLRGEVVWSTLLWVDGCKILYTIQYYIGRYIIHKWYVATRHVAETIHIIYGFVAP